MGVDANDRTEWLLLVPSACWFAGLVLVAIISGPGFWFLTVGWSFALMLVACPLLLWAGGVVITGFIAAWRRRRVLPRAVVAALTPPIIIALGVLAFFPMVRGTQYLMTWGVLLRNHARYEDLIRQVERGTLPSASSVERVADVEGFAADSGSPHRVVFQLTGWNSMSQGILYDPTGLRGSPCHVFDYHWTLKSCSHMIGNYYDCNFDPDGD